MPARKAYTCSVCGKIGFWNKDWSYYGSVALVDTCPNDLVFTCSDECREKAEKKINSGKWRLPTLKMSPGGGIVIRERKGY